jgi:hypothetical protein
VKDPAYDFLGITPREIADYTPAEIDQMMNVAVKRWQRDQTLADLRTARICSILTSTKKDPHPPQEFMIDYQTGDKVQKKSKKQTPEEIAAILRSMTIQLGGKVNEV